MGVEGEDFIGNPNKIEFTDDELEYEEADSEVGAIIWVGTPDDDIDVDVDDVLDDNYMSELYHDLGEEDDDDDDEYTPDEEDFLSDVSDDNGLVMVDGTYVQVGALTDESDQESASAAVSDIDNNEVYGVNHGSEPDPDEEDSLSTVD